VSDQVYLPIVTALAGVLLGGFVAEFHNILQGRRERRRALRIVLYRLLQLRFQVQARRPERIIATVSNYVRQQGVDVPGQEIARHPLFKRALSKVLDSQAHAPLADSYSDAVDALASYAPVLAYSLSGEDRFLRLDASIQQYCDEILQIPEVAAAPLTPTIEGPMRAATAETAAEAALDALAETIATVAGFLSRNTLRSAKRFLKHQDEYPTLGHEGSVRMDKLLSGLAFPNFPNHRAGAADDAPGPADSAP